MVVPLLIKGLRSRITATRRQSAVIIDNMSKLVDDPIDAETFIPLLMPALGMQCKAKQTLLNNSSFTYITHTLYI